MKAVDLHVHSNKSDGSLTPTQLAELAVSKGLAAFALTDHDSTAGLQEAREAGARLGIEVISGIEFSTEYQGRDIHIVGLFIEENTPVFRAQIQTFVDARIHRNETMCARLSADGIAISYEALTREYPDCVITRAHYARYLLDHGYVKSLPEAFDRYVGDHCKYFVPREKVTPSQAVQLVLQAGGVPILAHPLLYGMGKEALHTLVRTLREAGLAGLEAIYSTYTPAQTREMKALASQYDLLISGGSDFHGKNKPGLELGTGYGRLFVPEEILDRLKDKRNELRQSSPFHEERSALDEH